MDDEHIPAEIARDAEVVALIVVHDESENPHLAAQSIGGKALGLADGDVAVLPTATEGQVLKRGAAGWEAGGVPAEITVYKQDTEPAIATDAVAIWCDTANTRFWLIHGTDGTVGGNKKVEMG